MHIGMDSQPYVKLYVKLAKGCLILPSLVTEFNEVYNSRKNQLYTYKTYETCLLGKISYTLT